MRRVAELPLWIGTARDARDLRGIHEAGIEAVVDLAMDEPPVQPTRELVCLRFPLVDGGGNPAWLLSAAVHAVENLLWHGIPTLVACGGGMSRSVCIATKAVNGVSAPEPPDDTLQRITAGGVGDIHPLLWDEVKRSVESVNEPKYAPRDV